MSTIADNPIRSGVDTATLFATLDAVKDNNEIAKFPPNSVPAKMVTEDSRPIDPSAQELARTPSFGRSGSLSAASLLRPRNSAAVPTRASTAAAA